MTITGKVALVTGSGQGIGLGIALRLAKDGADLCLVDLDQAKLDAAAKQVKDLGRKVITIIADVSDRDKVFAAVAQTEKELGGLDIMINNAGIAQVKALLDITPADMDKICKVNIDGVLWGIQAAAESFKKRNIKGKIINAASVAAHEAYAMLGAYCVTKFAVRSLTGTAARELAPFGITVNSYCPGIVDTNMWTQIDQAFAEETGADVGQTYTDFCKAIALGRAQTPEDVANLVSFFSSSDADYITGQCYITDGGIVYR